MPTITIDTALQELFTDLHESGLFKDGKVISDMEVLVAPEEVLAIYRKEKGKVGFSLKVFFDRYFRLQETTDSGFVADTNRAIKDHIYGLWDVLQREPDAPEFWTTKINLPHPYVVPGGRFNEIYYWDSYFTMLGLVAHDRLGLVRGMVDNFKWMIDQFGFIPNGSRTYFLGRSQPPFFALMVELLLQHDRSVGWSTYLPALKKEYGFWMDGAEHLSPGQVHRRVLRMENGTLLNRYFDDQIKPRPEMYQDDVELLAKGGADAKKLLLDIRAACESGWDFSSRWCTVPIKLETIRTTDVLPIDLNCLLWQLETTLAEASARGGDLTAAKKYQQAANERREAIVTLFWNAETGFFHDYDHERQQPTEAMTLAAVFPLFFELLSDAQAQSVADILRKQFLQPGGLLTTPITSGQQWDAPNGWAPLQYMAVRGLERYNHQELADTVRQRWLDLCRKVYKNTGKLMEKYNVVDTNLESGGGEYPVQDGFGWTNGVYVGLGNFIKS